MSAKSKSRIPDILKKYQADILNEWMKEQAAVVTRQQALMKTDELREQSNSFVRLLQRAASNGSIDTMEGTEWNEIRDLLTAVSRSRGLQGMTPSETATFVFSF